MLEVFLEAEVGQQRQEVFAHHVAHGAVDRLFDADVVLATKIRRTRPPVGGLGVRAGFFAPISTGSQAFHIARG